MKKYLSLTEIVLLVLICGIFCALALLIRYPHDDAFISFRYASNLVKGYGLVYSPGGERVEGYSNFLWVLLMSPSFFFGVSPLTLARILGIISGVGTIIVTYILSRRMSGSKPGASLLAAAALGTNLSLASWSTTGLETDMFTLFALAGVAAYWGESEGKGRWGAWGLFFGVAALIRPEGWFLPLVLWGFELASLLIAERVFSEKRKNIPWQALVRGSLVFAVIFIPYFAWRWNYFGYPLPNPFYAKVGFTQWVIVRGLRYAGSFMNRYNLIFILLIPSLLMIRRLKDKEIFLFIWLFSFWTAYAIAIGGDHMSFYRIFVPALPFAVLWGQKVFQLLLEGKGKLKRVGIVTAVFILWLMPWANPRVWKDIRWNESIYTGWISAGKALANYAKPGETLAVTTAGAIPFYSGLETIDMLGLNDIHTAHMPTPDRMGQGAAGHDKGDAGYVLSRKPAYIAFFPWVTVSPQINFKDGLKLAKFEVEKAIANDADFRRHYKVIAIPMEDGRFFNIFKSID